MPNTYQLIKTYTLASSATSIEWTGIPNTYTDLYIKLSLRTDYSAIDTYFNCNFNSDTGANYSQLSLYQTNGGLAGSNSWTAQNNLYVNSTNGNTSTTSVFAAVDIHIPNYAGSTYKSIIEDAANENNTTLPTTRFNPISSGLWSSTAAITSIKLAPPSGNWLTYSTASLYGILKA
jgi:hypothetical protein